MRSSVALKVSDARGVVAVKDEVLVTETAGVHCGLVAEAVGFAVLGA
jgi:hypothetical protein